MRNSNEWQLFPNSIYKWSGVNLSTSPKTFNNLLGDKYDYKLITCLNAVDSDTASSELRMYFNSDDGSTDANYRYYEMHGTSATAGASIDNAIEYIPIAKVGDENALYSSFSEFYIYGKSGNERLIEGQMGGYSANAPYVYESNGSFLTDADEITSINILDGTNQVTSGVMYLFRRLKDSGYQSNGWIKIEKQTVSAQDMFNTPVVFNNLLGDSDVEYKIESELDASVAGYQVRMYFNNELTETDYKTQALINTSGSLASAVYDIAQLNMFNLISTNSSSTIYISPKSGQYRASISKTYNPATTQGLWANWYESDADEITSITLKTLADQTGAITGTFRLYKRSKKRSSYGKRLISDNTINQILAGANAISVPNLKNNKMYEIVIDNMTSDTDYNLFYMLINGDTSYDIQRLRASGAVITSSFAGGDSTIFLGYADTTYSMKLRMLIMPYNNGDYRCCLSNVAYAYSGANQHIETSANWWKNNTDDIQSILIRTVDIDINIGDIKVYEIDLPETSIVVPDTWTAENATLSVQDDKLVAYWKAEDVSDSVGANTLTNNGAVTFTAGKNNNAFTLNGSSQYLNTASTTDIAFGTGDFTVSCWVKPDNYDDTYDIYWASNNFDELLLIRRRTGASDGGKIQCYVGGNLYIFNYQPSNTGVWRMFTLSRISGQVDLYVNDTKYAGTTLAGSVTEDVFQIGYEGAVNGYFGGQIDQIPIWKGYGATQTFVTALYNSGTGAFRV